ncbi:MAG: SCP2 sterol-binding domain-containing protein [Candidatus Promineifilaceae bacterium]|nr:SCP2 sterol-binding domain-containing protein [Candidatus Promineifilaceae bacterium]
MAHEFPSDGWVKAAQAELNSSDSYREAAANWEGDIVFLITALPGGQKEQALYMDLWHGECRDAYAVDDMSEVQSEFTITAPFPVWKKVLEGDLDPIRGLVSRQLKLKGNMMKVMKAPRAAVELVNSCAQVDTEWPA